MNTEPALTVTAITTLVAAVLGLLVAFGLDISQDQQTAILSVIGAAYAVGTPLLIRARVDSPATVDEKVDVALHTPVPD
jgi:ABC-type arginine/histidine transport system permease subunit